MDWMLGLQVRGLLPPQLPSLYNISSAEKKKLDRVFGKVVVGKDLWTPYGKSVKRDFERLAGVIASLELGDLAVKLDSTPESELDVYEHFHEEEDKEDIKESEGRERVRDEVVDSKPPVVSTLTTTETTVLPDGTIYSRRILKQRFADGREESNEEVSSGRSDKTNDDGTNAYDKNRNGWFWT